MSANLKLVEHEASDAELRAELCMHIEQRDAALKLRDAARDAADRAEAFVGGLETSMAEFADTDTRIAASRAQAFKEALAKGNATPMLSLSPELSAIAGKRLDVANQLNAARQARECLTEELNDAERALLMHQGEVERGARAVVAFHADAMARQLAETEKRAGAMRRRLLGITALRQGAPYPVGADTVTLLRSSPSNHAPGGNDANDTRYWDSWRDRLTHDSAAKPDEF